jgi:hypothetical protein
MDIATKDDSFFARDQDILFKATVASLNLSPDDVLGNAVDLGTLGPILKPFLGEFLKSGTILGQKIADPEKTLVLVLGNKALTDLAVGCMGKRDDRIKNLQASISAAFNRKPTPFDIFDQGLMDCMRATALSPGSSFQPEDIRVWTALHDDTQDPVPAAVSPANVAAASPAGAVRAEVEERITSAGAESALASPAAVDPGLLQPRPGELVVGPVPFQQTVQGIPLSVPVSAFLSIQPVGTQIQIGARVVADLSDLQNKVGSLIDTIPLPTDNCAHFGFDNIVARIWGKEITIAADLATLTLHGDVDVWACANIPLIGVSKTPVGTQPFDATLSFRATVVDSHTIGMQLGQPAITLGGQFGFVTQWLIGSLGVNLNAVAKNALDGLINPNLLQQTLPANLLQLNPVLSRAELTSNSGALALYAEMSASIDGAQLIDLLRKIFG